MDLSDIIRDDIAASDHQPWVDSHVVPIIKRVDETISRNVSYDSFGMHNANFVHLLSVRPKVGVEIYRDREKVRNDNALRVAKEEEMYLKAREKLIAENKKKNEEYAKEIADKKRKRESDDGMRNLGYDLFLDDAHEMFRTNETEILQKEKNDLVSVHGHKLCLLTQRYFHVRMEKKKECGESEKSVLEMVLHPRVDFVRYLSNVALYTPGIYDSLLAFEKMIEKLCRCAYVNMEPHTHMQRMMRYICDGMPDFSLEEVRFLFNYGRSVGDVIHGFLDRFIDGFNPILDAQYERNRDGVIRLLEWHHDVPGRCDGGSFAYDHTIPDEEFVVNFMIACYQILLHRIDTFAGIRITGHGSEMLVNPVEALVALLLPDARSCPVKAFDCCYGKRKISKGFFESDLVHYNFLEIILSIPTKVSEEKLKADLDCNFEEGVDVFLIGNIVEIGSIAQRYDNYQKFLYTIGAASPPGARTMPCLTGCHFAYKKEHEQLGNDDRPIPDDTIYSLCKLAEEFGLIRMNGGHPTPKYYQHGVDRGVAVSHAETRNLPLSVLNIMKKTVVDLRQWRVLPTSFVFHPRLLPYMAFCWRSGLCRDVIGCTDADVESVLVEYRRECSYDFCCFGRPQGRQKYSSRGSCGHMPSDAPT